MNLYFLLDEFSSKETILASSFDNQLKTFGSLPFVEDIDYTELKEECICYIPNCSLQHMEEILFFLRRNRLHSYLPIVNTQDYTGLNALITLGCNHFLMERVQNISRWIRELKQAMSFPGYLPLEYQDYVLRYIQAPYRNQMSEKRLKKESLEHLLTQAEMKVFMELIQGKSNRQIAEACHFAVSTVRDHMSHILRKLEASNRIHLINKAVEYGYIDLPVTDEIEP
ncbi:response regulator transcription factor [Bacillus piscicola]|uniref:response regulator transcription factor n=1 Tax=Bacillus piscicola TaxID=1632684 RepID=UPI001F088C99|nr:LuxR C-terminal-related transcriptional regulator [Bacillus piscicola]